MNKKYTVTISDGDHEVECSSMHIGKRWITFYDMEKNVLAAFRSKDVDYLNIEEKEE